jgi:hypothetical protein
MDTRPGEPGELQQSAKARQPDQRFDDDGVLVGADEDRWAWRAKLKRNPATRRAYRFAVGTLGVLLIVLAGLTGWLPGPGGIPLALVGLAVLASEFEWAERLLDRVKDALRRSSDWVKAKPTWFQRLGVLLTVVLVLGGLYLYLLVLGVPTWLPGSVENALISVPGL